MNPVNSPTMKNETQFESQKSSKALVAAAFFALAAMATVLFTLLSTLMASDAKAMPMVQRETDETPDRLRTEVYSMSCVEAATVPGPASFGVRFVVSLNSADVPKTGAIVSKDLGQCRDGQAEITQGALGGNFDIFELRAGGDSLCKEKRSVEASLYYHRATRMIQSAVLKIGADRYNCTFN